MTKKIHSVEPRIIEMQPDYKRILEAVVFVIQEAANNKKYVTRYDIVKTLFFADRRHLNNFGRPITFDNYCALDHGPVPNFAYDLIKSPNGKAKNKTENNEDYWATRLAPHRGRRAIEYIPKKRKTKFVHLSDSDKDALRWALGLVQGLSFEQIRVLTHSDAAYVSAWKDGAEKISFPMSYDLLFDDPSVAKEMVDNLAYMSRHT